MTPITGGSPLFRKIMVSILLASTFFLSLLTLVVYYSNEILEDELLAKQADFELKHIESLLRQDSSASLPRSANLNIFLASRQDSQPIPGYMINLEDGVHHDVEIEDKAYHVMISAWENDRIYIRYDVTEIERSEELLSLILIIAWIVLIFFMFLIAGILSKRLSGPIAQLSQELSQINPDQRGVRLGDHYEDDEVGRIAQAFDTYTSKMDGYVEKQTAFAAMASHELRSPLTIVQTSTDLIASRHDLPDINPHLEKIQRATANMANIIHALLAVTREQPIPFSEHEVVLKTLVDDIIEPMKPEISAKKITIENRISQQATLRADRTLITVVLTNLIRNSVKHGEQSTIMIQMEGQVLSIIDSGIGIDEATLQRIFDFGYRGKESQGYGIGLYISKLICDYQQWSLDLAPNPSGGTVATIRFQG